MKPVFYWPIKPYVINQAWGVYNTIYQQFGFTRHNGLDLQLAPTGEIYAPFDFTVARRAFQPNGGGIFVGIMSEPIAFPAFTCLTPDKKVISFSSGTYRVLADFLHCKEIRVIEGQKGKAGDLLAIGDNTGFSTGPHCHWQMRRVSWDGKVITTVDVNDANNSFDPTQFYNKIYAADIPKLISLNEALVEKLQEMIALLLNAK